MSASKKLIISILLTAMILPTPPVMAALTLQQAVNSIQATDPVLPTGVANPKGSIGSLLAELFWGTGDGVKNGKIKPQYIDYSGISAWTQSGSNAYYGGTGSVGIGTMSPGQPLHIEGAAITSGDARSVAILADTTAYAVGVGGGVVFRGKFNAGGTLTNFGFIKGIKENATDGNWSSALVLGTNLNGSASAEHMRITSGGNVGIGTTSPGTKLEISGIQPEVLTTGEFWPKGTLQITDNGPYNGGTGPTITFYKEREVGTHNQTIVGAISWGGTFPNHQLQFWGNSSGANTLGTIPSMVIRNNGNVGIGTTSPEHKLDIQGTVSAGTATAGGEFRIEGKGGVSYPWHMRTTNITGLDFTSDRGIAKVAFLDNGNVGIGTASPNKLLHLKTITGTNAELDIQSGSKPLWGIYHDETSEELRFWNGANRVVFGSGGNVGIGTTSPGGKLEVFDAVSANTIIKTSNTAGYSELYLYNNGASGRNFAVGVWGNTSGYSQSFYIQDVTAGVNRLTVSSSGNVGIGTTLPQANLHINTGVATSKLRISSNSNALGLDLWNDGGSVGHSYIDSSVDNASYKMIFRMRSLGTAVNALTLDGGGNVGIGTTSPGSKLQVEGTNSDIFVNSSLWAQSTISFQHNAGTTYLAHVGTYTQGANNVGLAFAVGNNAITSPSMYIKQNGNVGIGTTDPNAKLQIESVTRTTPANQPLVLTSPTTAIGDKLGISFSQTDNYSRARAGIYAISELANGYASSLGFFTRNAEDGTQLDSADEKMRITSGGRVGIGTTDPQAKLDVTSSTDAATMLRLAASGGGNYFDFIRSPTTGAMSIQGNQIGYNNIILAPTSGNVGIGTTDPGVYKLYVNGTGYLGAAAWVYASDRRLKENIIPLRYGIDEIMKLDTKKFDYIHGEKNNLGFIAQDVQKIFPELVTTGSGGILWLKTDMIIPVLVNAVKELKTQKDSEIQELKKQNQEIKSLVCLDHPNAAMCK